MNCFLCGTYLDSIRFMRHHFRFFHNLTEKYTYVCTFGGDCNQCFTLLSTLIRHVKRHMHTTQGNDQQINLAQNSTLPSPLHSFENSSATLSTPSSSLISENDNTIDSSEADSVSLNDFDENVALPALQTNSIQQKGLEFALKLHSYKNLTRKDVIGIQKIVMENIVNPIVKTVTESLERNICNDIEEDFLRASLIQEISQPFQSCSSEIQLFIWLRRNDYLCYFKEFEINREISEKYSRGEIRYDEVDITGVLLPLYFQFRKVFEKNDQLLKTLNYIENIANTQGLIDHFMHGSLWREKSQPFLEAGKIVLPFFLYIDDSEINNPLGPHSNPVTFIYYSFPIFKSNEVFLASSIEGRDYKQYGNEKCLRALIDEIIRLEENGILIKTSEGERTVYFVLALVIGDNLGLNTILGFTPSFNHNFFCRFCKAIKSSTHKMCIDDQSLSRNLLNYDEDVNADDISSTGIKEFSIFNMINSFHVTTNFAVDIMHDIFEGVCHYDMCHIIKYLTSCNYFSLRTLNVRKQMFNYGEIEIGNISPKITEAHLTNSHLKMTAREMMTFMHLFPLMVGDLVPRDDHVWLFLLNLSEIIDILLLYEIPSGLAERLRHLIKQHHLDYVRFFNDTLKPKHHLMTHYFQIIFQSGPPRYYWTFRYEAKHKEFKTYARNITSRKNICVSIARKYQLQFANYLIEHEEPSYTINPNHIINSNYKELITSFCNHNGINSENFLSYSQCKYHSKMYKKGYFISQYLDTVCPVDVLIYEIVEIILFCNCDSVYLICKRTTVEKYHKHFAAYDINISSAADENERIVICIDSLYGPPVNVHTTAKGLKLIRPKQYC